MPVGLLVLQIGLAVGAVLFAGSSARRQVASALLLCISAAVPWVAPPTPILRLALAALTLIAFLRVVEVGGRRDQWTARRRLRLLTSWYDAADEVPSTPPPTAALARSATLHAVVAIVVFAVLVNLEFVPPAARGATRYTSGIALVYALMGALSDLSQLGNRMAGLVVPPAQRAPADARSVAEFWGRRWNRMAGGWLARFVFRPLARRTAPEIALVVTFAVSGAMHAWLVAAALDWRWAAAMASYFLVEGAIVLAETRLRPQRWPRPVARAWTYLALLAPSPLFLEPFLRLY